MEIINLIISGYYSDFFFNIFVTQFMICIQNNFALLMLFAVTAVKMSKLTNNLFDDKIANYILNFLHKFHKTSIPTKNRGKK